MNHLVLIDGNAILHRAYHALPPLTAPDGSMVNAVYGFVLMLIKIFNELKPTHVAVAFDRPEPTFRKELFTDYQAKRPKMASDLVPQIEKIKEAVTAFGIPIFEVAGFEADDVIGTLAQKTNDEVVIVTGDRDLLQLVSDRVKVFLPVKGLSEGKLFGEEEVTEKMGVPPKQISGFKALAGDASDNYPGVAGIGPKTAIRLLTGYGSVEKIIAAGKLSGKEKNARLGLELATIKTDVPIEMGQLPPIATLNTPKAREALAALGFKSLLKRLTTEERKASEQQQLF